MKRIGNPSFLTKLLLTTNILTIVLLVLISFNDHFPQRICSKLSGKQSEQNYTDNIYYAELTAAYPLYTEQKNIVMLGNSLTSFAEWTELLNRPDVANRGVGADVTAGFISRLGNIISIKPKICFIEGGVNDLSIGVSQDVIIKNLTLIIDTLQVNGIKPVLTTVTLVTKLYNKSSDLNEKIKYLNKKIIQLAQEKNIKLIDLNQYVGNGNFLPSEYAIRDGIHFTAKTYLIWKQEVEKILKEENI